VNEASQNWSSRRDAAEDSSLAPKHEERAGTKSWRRKGCKNDQRQIYRIYNALLIVAALKLL
jgi:hypothetical protein